jgi:hypothetical protein
MVVYGRTLEEAMKTRFSLFHAPSCMQHKPAVVHDRESWMNCYDTFCNSHWQEKVRYNTFPRPDNGIPTFHTAEQTQRFTTVTYQNEGFTILAENLAEYPLECIEKYMPVEDCLSYYCKIHQNAKIEQWHDQQEKAEEAGQKCDFHIQRCWDWNCPHHLESKQIALDQAREADDNENTARKHLKKIEGWESELRRKQTTTRTISTKTEKWIKELQQIPEKEEEQPQNDTRVDQAKNEDNRLQQGYSMVYRKNKEP